MHAPALPQSAPGQRIHKTSSNLRSAVFCKFCCLCPLDARWRCMSLEFSMWSLEWCQKKWRVISPKAPHRVQSHYRPCQIQLVTEFAVQERGEERRDGAGWGVGMKWISWWENSWAPVLIIKNKEKTFLLKCTSDFAEDGQFYLLAWTMIRLAYFRESTEAKSFPLNEIRLQKEFSRETELFVSYLT